MSSSDADLARQLTDSITGGPDTAASTADAPDVGPPCSKCGAPMPPLDPELARIARANPGVVLAHEVCPGDTPPAPEGRYFEVRVQVVEVTEVPAGTFVNGNSNVPSDETRPHVEELLSFRHGLRAADLDAAMRPLALGLGEKWTEAEKRAKIADAR